MKSFVKSFADRASCFGKLRESQALKQALILVPKESAGGTGGLLKADLLNSSSHCLGR